MIKLPASNVVPAERKAIVFGILKIISLKLAIFYGKWVVLGICFLYDAAIVNRLHFQMMRILKSLRRNKYRSNRCRRIKTYNPINPNTARTYLSNNTIEMWQIVRFGH